MNKKIIITGGCGFIGCNAAERFLEKGWKLVIVDDLSRKGSPNNLNWLKKKGEKFDFYRTDVRDFESLEKVFRAHKNAAAVLHLAAQVAVTTSITDPATDFEINALGTFNTLEAAVKYCPKAAFLYSSTNKVYGGMENARVLEKKTRYIYGNMPNGVKEDFPLDFHSPYGCSKGTADQYVRDYYRIYGLKTVVFRQSCIYGERQFGVEDQGWVAHFIIQTILGRGIYVYGDGKQVRDILNVQDLVSAYEAAINKIGKVKGEIFNIGGGSRNKISLIELIAFLNRELGIKISYEKREERAGDQKIFVSDNSKLKKHLGWKVTTNWQDGVRGLISWVKENRELFY